MHDAQTFLYDPAIHEIDDEGYVTLDGEIVAHLPGPGREPFEVRTAADADRLLERKMNLQAEIAAIEAKKAALISNLDSQAVGPRAQLAYIERFQEPLLVDYAKRNMPAKGKTLKLDHGQVAFRRYAETIEITDHGKALEFAERYAPDLVRRTATVGVEGVKAAIEAREKLYGPGESHDFVRTVAAGDRATVRTGFKAKGE